MTTFAASSRFDLAAHAMRIADALAAPVFPVAVSPDPKNPGKTIKRPLVKGWANGAAVMNPDGIEALFSEHPDATHVGVQTGQRSRLVVIDLDGEPALRWWREHTEQLPVTYTVQTRRHGGRHLYYRLPVGVELRNSAGKIAEGVDVRASGGFVVDWSSENGTSGEEIADAPAALIKLVGDAGRGQESGTCVTASALGADTVSGIPQGKRNHELTRLAGQMRRTGWERQRIESALQAINAKECVPPLESAEVGAIAASIGRYEPAVTSASIGKPLELQWFAGLHAVSHANQLVKGLLQAATLFVVFGESNSGKTFFILDLALSVASGKDWRGKRCRSGLAIYVAGEGAASVRARVAAYRRRFPELPDNLPFAIVPQAVDFMNTESVAALIAAIADAQTQCGLKAALVVVDTFARSVAGGDENSAQDVGVVVAGADRIRAETGAAVGFVHHAGKDPSKGARGSSALRAATDTEILIEGQAGQRTATVTKQRDLECGERMPFELEAVEIGIDPDDRTPISSCVVRHVEADAISTVAVRQFRGKAQRHFVDAMRARSEADPQRIWSLMDLRSVARELGQTKSTARAVVDVVAHSPYMCPSVGGYLFTDGRDEERKGTK